MVTFGDYRRDVAQRYQGEYSWQIMEMGHEQRPLECWFVGSLTVLAIPVLAIAYIVWDAYRMTTR